MQMAGGTGWKDGRLAEPGFGAIRASTPTIERMLKPLVVEA
jgi:hypothetical protein